MIWLKRCLLVLILSALLGVTAVGAPTTIRVWAMGEEGLNLEKLIPAFERENPDIRVEIMQIPWALAYDKMITAVAGGTTPDVTQIGTTWMAPFAAMGALAPLNEFIERSAVLSADDFFPGSWGTAVVEGVIYGIPWYVDVRVLYYRTDLLQEAGFDRPPATWDELRVVGKALADIGDFGMGLSPHWQEFLPFVWQAGGDLLDEAMEEPLVTEPEFVEALEFFVSLFRDGIAPLGIGEVDLFHAFATGFFPMYFSGPWMVELIRARTPEIDGLWSIAPMPRQAAGTSFIGGANFAIFEGTRNKEAAWRFLEFMGRAETQVEWYRILRGLPAVKAAWEDPLLMEEPIMAVFHAQLLDAKSPPAHPGWEEIARALMTRVEEAIHEITSPAEAAELLDGDLRRILGRL